MDETHTPCCEQRHISIDKEGCEQFDQCANSATHIIMSITGLDFTRNICESCKVEVEAKIAADPKLQRLTTVFDLISPERSEGL